MGHKGSLPPRRPPNLKSALEHPLVVDAKLQKEISLGRLAGPFPSPPFPDLQLSPIGLVEKKTPGQFRLIHHLSYPHGESINDGISDAEAHVQYQTVDHAIKHIQQLGSGCFLAKTDIADAFRIVPLHPEDYHLFGFHWKDQYYFDKCLPMGCRSSCRLFESLSEALQWVATVRLGIDHVAHVLDDFLFLARSEEACRKHLEAFLRMCDQVGIPIAPEKTTGPSQVLTFLGIEIDSIEMVVRLPEDKVIKCRTLVDKCLQKEKIKLRDLQVVIGSLNFACSVVVPGRAFLRRLIDATIGVSKPFHYIRITNSMRKDLALWQAFLQTFNGKSMLLPQFWLHSPHLHLFTDASGSLGYGAVLDRDWFFGAWDTVWAHHNITIKELYPIVMAVSLWAERFANKCIALHTDNEAVVHILNAQSSRDTQIMHLVRKFVLTCLQHNIHFKALHVPGINNPLADALSRLQVDKFKKLAPSAAPLATPVPPLPTLPR